MTAHGWTISEACAEFERTGLTIAPRGLRVIVRNLPAFQRIGEKKSGRGGRGEALYEIADFQLLHRALAPWLTAQDPGSGDT